MQLGARLSPMSAGGVDEDGAAGGRNDWQVDVLFQKFSEYQIANREACLARFGEITRLTPAEARHFLETCQWDVRDSLAKAVETRRKQATQSIGTGRTPSFGSRSSGSSLGRKAADRMGNLRGLSGSSHSSIAKTRRAAPQKTIPTAVGARFTNRYGESIQLFWDAPGPNPKGSFLQGTLHPNTNLGMKTYVGHSFHAEVAGENVWSCTINSKPRQLYNIDRSQQNTCHLDLLEAFSFKDKEEPAPGTGRGSGGGGPFGSVPSQGGSPFGGGGSFNGFSGSNGAAADDDEMDL